MGECIALRKILPLSDPSNRLKWIKSDEEDDTRVAERAEQYRQLMVDFGGPTKTDFYEFLRRKVGVSWRALGPALSSSIHPLPLALEISSIGISSISARCSGGKM